MTRYDTVRLTYAELAKARGVSLGAARRMVQRHKWPRQIGNDGFTHIAVPATFVTRSDVVPPDVAPDVIIDVGPDVDIDTVGLEPIWLDEAVTAFATVARDVMVDVARDVVADVSRDVIGTLQEAITTLRVELYAQRDRAE